MAKKIYVGNMNYNTSEDTLRQLFAQYGEVVSVNVITDRYTGRAKGFGFVEMASEDAARAAMTALNGRELDGRQLKVNEANDKPRDSNSSGGGTKPLLLGEKPVRTGEAAVRTQPGPAPPFSIRPFGSERFARRRVISTRGAGREEDLMGRSPYQSEKRRKELARLKKQEEKRQRRFNKGDGDAPEGDRLAAIPTVQFGLDGLPIEQAPADPPAKSRRAPTRKKRIHHGLSRSVFQGAPHSAHHARMRLAAPGTGPCTHRPAASFFSILAQASFSDTDRLKTSASGVTVGIHDEIAQPLELETFARPRPRPGLARPVRASRPPGTGD